MNLPCQHITEITQPPRIANITAPDSNLYFFDYQQAYRTAAQHNQVSTTHPSITALQICFYDGPPQVDALENMISLPFEQVESRLIELPYQLPSQLIFPHGTPDNFINEIGRVFEQTLKNVIQRRKMLTARIQQQLKNQRPEFDKNTPLRILLKSSRLTTVMQHCSRQLARALEKQGHEVFLCMEENDMQMLDSYLHIKALAAFNPHVVFNINALDTQHLHPDVFYFSWWQDPMPSITRGVTLPWRERDITLSLTRNFDDYLQHCGCPEVRRQHFCIDKEIFNTAHDVKRENKIIFIGSSYRDRLRKSSRENGALQDIIARMKAGEPVDETFLRPLSQRWRLDYHRVYWDLFHYAVRDVTLQWLCREADIPIEVYGRGWQDDPLVRPHFRGELPHGEAVARAYNSARYAFICHPFEINSQRLVEAAACGSVPVVFDCRHIAEAPHWDEYCRFFRTAAQLRDRLHSKDDLDPTPIAQSFNYDHLADFVTRSVHERLGWIGPS
ncbi:MAG: hypothetical protein L3J88_10070 [Gammaproteobacteria bacterium]|nr:hypothetical protein [Gammaproteobacteria bacterium]MCF6363668.1 hypothetical protein [Gammaproteobacteria bacterium]